MREQILYAKALECYADLLQTAEEPAEEYRKKAERLQSRIFEKFFDREKGAFIDSYESGRRNVSRQSNILAYLFLPCSGEQRRAIYENVILNESVRQITTPYFKFYENQVHCLEGNGKLLERSIRQYYGSMLETGRPPCTRSMTRR